MAQSRSHWIKPKAPHSEAKTRIVVNYFKLWSTAVRKSGSKLVYLDLYAGKGQHSSGEKSTAVQVLQSSSKDKYLTANLIAILNDIKPLHCRDMRKVVTELGIDKAFQNKPRVLNSEANVLYQEIKNEIEKFPKFCFIDPYGYKGLTLSLVESVIKDWGCDCIVFLYTCGINRNIRNEKNAHHLKLLFGDRGYANLRKAVYSGQNRSEFEILNAFSRSAKEVGAKYILPLQFNFPNKNQISHHLVFLSKHHRGFHFIKEVMAGESIKEDGLPTYVYVEGADKSVEQMGLPQIGLLGELKSRIVNRFRGKSFKVKNLIELCHKEGWEHTEKKIKDTLKKLEGVAFTVTPPKGKKRRRGTLGGENTLVFFN